MCLNSVYVLVLIHNTKFLSLSVLNFYINVATCGVFSDNNGHITLWVLYKSLFAQALFCILHEWLNFRIVKFIQTCKKAYKKAYSKYKTLAIKISNFSQAQAATCHPIASCQ